MIKAIYIDPPYNTDATKIIYKNGYEHSTWMTLLENRLVASTVLLRNDAVVCTTIDDYEFSRLTGLLERIFGPDNHLATIAIRNNPSGRSTVKGIAINHEYGVYFAKSTERVSVGRLPHTDAQRARYSETDDAGRSFEWENFRKSSAGSFRADRPKQYFPIFYNRQTSCLRVPTQEWDEALQIWRVTEDQGKHEIAIMPKDGTGRERVWRYGVERTLRTLSEFQVRPSLDSFQIYTKKYLQRQGSLPRTWWDKSEYSARDNGTRTLAGLFGNARVFDFPKAPAAVMDSIRVCDPGTDGTVLDYFAGSGTTGHAVINLNREDGGRRKFILVEMGEYFDTVLLPRIKKVTFSPEWRDGKPQREASAEEADSSPRIVKYMRLESYEDALDGIEFDDTTEQLRLEDNIESYLLQYLLKWETKHSRTLLNIEELNRPFDYWLPNHAKGGNKPRNADIGETFNYLLGLNVRTRRAYYNDGQRYIVYRGEARSSPGRDVVVIWRDTEGWELADYKRDRQFVVDHQLVEGADAVYVNGSSCIPNARAVEPIFHSRMFADVTF